MLTPVNVRDVCYAEVKTDTASGITYKSDPISIAPAMSCKADRDSNDDTLYGDGEATSNQVTNGKITLDLELNEIPLDVLSTMLGHLHTAGSTANGTETPEKMSEKKGDKAPYIGIGVTYDLEDGGVAYKWFYKGRMKEPGDDVKQKETGVTYSTPTLSGTFIMPKSGTIRDTQKFETEPSTHDYKTLFSLSVSE